jgi:hypothetical protein
MVTPSRSVPSQSAKNADTGSSSRSAPVRTSSMTTLVVAITLVSDARSNGVWKLAGWAATSKVNAPIAPFQIDAPLLPTSNEAAGNTLAR